MIPSSLEVYFHRIWKAVEVVLESTGLVKGEMIPWEKHQGKLEQLPVHYQKPAVQRQLAYWLPRKRQLPYRAISSQVLAGDAWY